MSNNNEFLKSLGLSILDIPHELKMNMQWGVSTMKIVDTNSGRRDKAPRNPKTGELISVMSDEGWGTFDEAVNAGYPAIGMRLTPKDPYTVIDLDKTDNDQHNQLASKICRVFDSYQEISWSKTGVHIILKGPAEQGRRKNNVEVYSQDRYIICTGNVKNDKPIVDGAKNLQNLKDSLNDSFNPDTLPQVTYEKEKHPDQEILTKMFSAKNGEAVKNLYESIPSKSDDWSLLDARLAQHICFYTKNKEQALRIFKGSALYRGVGSSAKKSGYERTDKYEEDYLIRRTFNRAWYLIEQEKEQENLANTEYENMISERNQSSTTDGFVVPESSEQSSYEAIEDPLGLVGDIAKFIYNSAPRPVWEVAVAGALSFLSGLIGRHYNINGSGLGLYTVMLAKTGRGKEAANSGISSLMAEVSKNVPAVMMFRGPSHIASGQALLRMMGDTEGTENIPSKLLILSEFGHTLNVITSKDASSAEVRTRQVMLDMFSKNGWGNLLKESAYADKANNTQSVMSPNLCILGDTTPDMFFKSVNLDVINEGFLPRFLIVEYEGPRVKANYNINRMPPNDLVVRIQTLVHQIISLRDSDSHLVVQMDDEATGILTEFDDYCDDMINKDKPSAEMWNRAHLIALRLAGILAVGQNIFKPEVGKHEAEWAIALVKRSVMAIEKRIEGGQFGETEAYVESLVRSQIHKYWDENDIARYRELNDHPLYGEMGFLPVRYLMRTVGRTAEFKSAAKRKGESNLMSHIVSSLIDQGDIELADPRDFVDRGKNTIRMSKASKCYSKGVNYESNWKEQNDKI